MTAESCEVFHCRNERSWVITTLSCLISLAGFEVSLIGRFSGVPRGPWANRTSREGRAPYPGMQRKGLSYRHARKFEIWHRCLPSANAGRNGPSRNLRRVGPLKSSLDHLVPEGSIFSCNCMNVCVFRGPDPHFLDFLINADIRPTQRCQQSTKVLFGIEVALADDQALMHEEDAERFMPIR
jgi:hypothetical protein